MPNSASASYSQAHDQLRVEKLVTNDSVTYRAYVYVEIFFKKSKKHPLQSCRIAGSAASLEISEHNSDVAICWLRSATVAKRLYRGVTKRARVKLNYDQGVRWSGTVKIERDKYND